MKLKLKDVKKLIDWIDEHKDMVDTFFPKLNEMTVVVTKLRKQDRELIKTITEKPE